MHMMHHATFSVKQSIPFLSCHPPNTLICYLWKTSGMCYRVECCIRCLAQGVAATHIIDGRQPHSLLMELLTDTGVGTMITG